MNKFRSRKWLLSCSIELFSMLALLTGKIDSNDFSNITVAVIASYSFANAAEMFKKVPDNE